MGPALEEAGFQNVTNQLPDARWAAPGDVIVYKRTAAPNDAGHIDIRTYDGYLSDFWSHYLPISQFTVTGIYRKHSDLLPDKRLRAFLKVLREWECHEQTDDARRYFILQKEIEGKKYFSDTSKHPYEGRGGKSTFSGAYQIGLETWHETHDKNHTPLDFTPVTQDRVAVARLEFRRQNRVPRLNALGLVRIGKIREAINALLNEWTSLPGGDDARKGKPGNTAYIFTTDDFLAVYEQNLAAIK